jgi:hypothetical protein
MNAPQAATVTRPLSVIFHPRTPKVEAPDPVVHKEHLLKVAAASSRDAAHVWDELWAEVRRYQAANGVGEEDGQPGFSPSMGWVAFVEKLEELRHLIDGIERVCTHQ